MTMNFSGRCLAALIGLSLTAASASAQPFNIAWIADPATPADFNSGANWESGAVPAGSFEEAAFILNGGTAFLEDQLSGSSNAPGGLFVGATSTLEIRDTGSLTLSVPGGEPAVDRSALIQGTLDLQGAGFIDGENLTFPAQSTISYQLTGSTDRSFRTTGTTFLNGGTLNLDYSAIANPLGTITLGEGASISGSFGTINTTGLGANQGVALSEVNPTEGLSTLEATVFNQLVLQVNRDTNDITVINPHSTAVELDGFAVQTASGSLVSSNFTGLGNGFSNGPSSDNVVSQLFEGPDVATPAFSFAANSSTVIGTDLFLRAAPQAFQADPEDLEFTFTAPGVGGALQGVVEFIGTEAPIDNDIVLTIDGSGEGALLNASNFPQEIEAYRITSSDGSLTTATWTSLADQGIDGGIWSEVGFSGSDVLFELTEGVPGGNDSTTFAFTPDGVFNLGQIFATGGDQSGITFEFLLEGDSEFTTGSVVFGDLPDAPPLIGDYNGDGSVDAADYTVYRDNFGQDASALANRSPFVNGLVSEDDFDALVANFGSTLSAPAAAVGVPEPTGALIAGLIVSMITAAPVRRGRG